MHIFRNKYEECDVINMRAIIRNDYLQRKSHTNFNLIVRLKKQRNHKKIQDMLNRIAYILMEFS